MQESRILTGSSSALMPDTQSQAQIQRERPCDQTRFGHGDRMNTHDMSTSIGKECHKT